MAEHFFTTEYTERATLHDGTPVLLRLVRPDDKGLLRDGFEAWSKQSRYQRFFVAKSHLTDDELRYLTEIDQENHFAIGAIRDGGEGLGIARFIRLPGEPGHPVTAEAAIAVADDAQSKGLGRLLFMRLCAAAAERGIERFRCEVLGSNATMQAIIDLVAPVHTTEVGSGVLSIDFAVPPLSPEVATTHPPESGMYRFFRAVAQGAVQLTRRLRG